jgi:hypothetical protein
MRRSRGAQGNTRRKGRNDQELEKTYLAGVAQREISTSGGKSYGGTRAQPELWGNETKTVGEKNEEVERKRERKKIVRKGEGEEMGGRDRWRRTEEAVWAPTQERGAEQNSPDLR